MAAIYNPWQFSGQESELEDGLATPVYLEQADTVEDAMEGETDAPEMEDDAGMEDEGGEGGGHADMMAQALNTIQQQSTLISSLMAQLTRSAA